MNTARAVTVCLQPPGEYSGPWPRCLDLLLAEAPLDRLEVRIACRDDAPFLFRYFLGRLAPDCWAPQHTALPENAERFCWYAPDPPVALWLVPAAGDEASLLRLLFHDMPLTGEYVLWLRQADGIAAGWWELLRPQMQQRIDYLGRPAWADLRSQQIEWVRAQPWYRGVPFPTQQGRPGVPYRIGGLLAVRAACLREADFPPLPPPHGKDPWGHPGGYDVLLGAMAHQLGWSHAELKLF